MLRVVEYDPQHSVMIDLQDKDKWIEKDFLREWGRLHSIVGRGYSVVDEQDRLVVIGGVDMLWDGVGELWSLFGAYAAERKIEVHKIVKRQIQLLVTTLALYRIQAVILATDPVALRYIEALGLQREAELKSYFPFRQNGVMYARVL